jgi:hypothetical protein
MSNNPIKDTPLAGQTVVIDGKLVEQIQSLLESIDFVLNTGKTNAYTLANLPDASKSKESIIIITDHPDGYSLAVSNGTSWILVGTGTTSAAVNVTNAPAGNITAFNVQAALNGLGDLINQSVLSGASPTFAIANMTLDDSDLVVAKSANLQAFAEDVDDALLRARGTGISTSYVSSVAVGGTTFNQPAIKGEITSDEGYVRIIYAGDTNITVSDLSSTSTWVYVDKNSALQQQTTIPTRQDRTRKAFVMRIGVNTSTNQIIGFEYDNNPIGHYANSMRDLYEFLLAQGVPFKKDQVITGRTDNLGFDVSSGQLLEFGGTGDINNPNIKSFDSVDNTAYNLMSRTALVSSETNLVKYWDNAGTITALGSTTLVGHRLYRFSSSNFAMQYGQGNYANMSLAKAGVLTEDYVLNPALKDATFMGWWFIEDIATNTGNTGATITTAFVEYTLGIQGGVSSNLGGAVLKGNNGSDFLDAAAVRTNTGSAAAANPSFTGAITQSSSAADPADPSAGDSVQWLSDGTGSGDAGDVMVKINVGGTTKTATLIDYSAI